MHGIVKPSIHLSDEQPSWQDRVKAKLWEYRYFLTLVVAPTLIVAGYYYLFASDQYESESDFIVRSAQATKKPSAGIGALLIGMGGGGGGLGNYDDAMSVIDYLGSTEAVLQMEKSAGLVKRFDRPGIDYLSRLRSADTPEGLRSYYNKQVKLKYDKETGITKLTVHAFTPEDAYAIANQLFAVGEQRVNLLNRRSNQDALRSATKQLAEAEDTLRELQVRMTAFRRTQNDIDPEQSGRTQMTMVSGLTGALAQARSQLQSMRGIIAPSSPQFVAAAARVRALEAEVGRQNGRLAGGSSGSIASTLGDFESLRVRQEFAVKRYEIASASYQSAREDARKQELYLVRVVNPNLPVKSLFPERERIVLTWFAALTIAYGVIWLMAAGIREHANG